MRQIFAVLMLFALVVATSAIVQARGAPQHDQPFAVEKVMNAAPVLTSIPPLSTGYDVILNISETKTLQTSVTTAHRGQSTTGAWRNDLKQTNTRDLSPELVLLT